MEKISAVEGGLVETKPGIFEIKGFSFPDLVYGFSSKDRGNFSYTHSQGKFDEVIAHRTKFATDLGINPKKVVQMNVAHGDKIVIATAENAHDIGNNDDSLIFPNTDAMVTTEKGVALFLLTADCLPIILFDPVKKVLALVHVGRLGAALNLPVKVVSMMVTQFGCVPSDIVAAIGPGIGPECYLYDEIPVEHSGPDWEKYVRKTGEKFGIDFVGYTTDSLKSVNVQVRESGECVDHGGRFFSNHKSAIMHESQKRFATIAVMK